MPRFHMLCPAFRPIAFALLLALSALTTVFADQTPTKVTFTATDGYWIYADYYAPAEQYRNPSEQKAPIILLVHDASADRSAWLPLVEPLRRTGAAVLAPDLRGHGESATTQTRERAARADPELFRQMQSDLRGAYDWLANQDGLDRARFSLVGAGTGAAVALAYAAKDCSVDVVVCLSPPWDHDGVNPAAEIGQVRGRRLLLVAGAGEDELCKSLAQRAKGAQVHACQSAGRGVELLSSEPTLCHDIAKTVADGMGPASTTLVCSSIESNIYHAADSGWVSKIHPTNLRYYSSPDEAEARGLRRARSPGPDQRGERQRRQP